MSGRVYAVRLGPRLKVGKTAGGERRLRSYRSVARRFDLPFEVLYLSPRHAEYHDNERATLARFRPAGQRDEYLANVDANEVVAFMRALPCTPNDTAIVDDSHEWMTAGEATDALRVSTQTVLRYVKVGHIARSRPNASGRGIDVHVADVARVRAIREQDMPTTAVA